jgi:RNA recognition motif-containing protein
MAKKIFVGNLSYKTDEEALREVFAKIGEVQSVKIITDTATGRSKGFGFVEMTSDADADKAIAELNGTTLLDRPLTVNVARPQTFKNRDRAGGGGGGRGRQGGFNSGGRKSGNWR